MHAESVVRKYTVRPAYQDTRPRVMKLIKGCVSISIVTSHAPKSQPGNVNRPAPEESSLANG